MSDANNTDDDRTEPDGRGWFKVYRKITESRVFQDAELLRLFIWLLSKAAFRRHWATPAVELKPGQLLFGRHAAAHELRTAPSTTYDRLKRLAEFGMVGIESGNSFSVVTIVNWQVYQDAAPLDPAANPTTRRHPADNAPTHKKNVKNVKNAKNSSAQSLPVGFDDWWKTYPRKVAKLDGAKAYAAAIERLQTERGISPESASAALLEITTRYAAAVQGNEQQFIPYPASWLNAGRYDDDPSTWNQGNDQRNGTANPSPARIRTGRYDNDNLNVLRPRHAAGG